MKEIHARAAGIDLGTRQVFVWWATAGHFNSWLGLSPRTHQSGGTKKRKRGKKKNCGGTNLPDSRRNPSGAANIRPWAAFTCARPENGRRPQSISPRSKFGMREACAHFECQLKTPSSLKDKNTSPPMKSLPLILALIPGLALTGCHWNPFQKIYAATAVVEISPVSPDYSGAATTGMDQVALPVLDDLQSKPVSLAVIKDLNLGHVWAQRFGSSPDPMPDSAAVDYLKKNLTIEQEKGTNLYHITARGEMPREAADIANAVVDEYKKSRDAYEDQTFERAFEALRQKMFQQQKVVEDKRAVWKETSVKLRAAKLSPNAPTATNDGAGTDLLAEFKAAEHEFKEQTAIYATYIGAVQKAAMDHTTAQSPVKIVTRAVPPAP